ncbi:MAG: circularly permuted type 2 ATP-grasp protein [Verrucomicrobiota bacterium]
MEGGPVTQNRGRIPAALEPVVRDYQVGVGQYDEFLDEEGGLRPGWENFLKGISKLRREDFIHRWREAKRLIRDNGVTYNVYDDEQGMGRPWELDPIPFVIAESEWKQIEAGLIQRARVFDHLLIDCYGARKLIGSGVVPPEFLYANPRFLRPCVGLPNPKDRFLHLYSADIARGPNGRWWVLADRTQAPSGMGYALENRVVQTRMLPEAARECGLVRIAEYFREVLETLARVAPRPRENPGVVLLTPGPLNETYFEHAFLARYLGITLVEGEDLTVRDDRVYLKTLEGLQRVDVIFRRLDEGFVDPLELMSESQIGVAGLLEAIRKRNVTVVNPPGSGLAEAPALLAFLPSICSEVLGEELLMPSVATWWCGQSTEMAAVLDRLENLVIKDAFDKGHRQPRFLRDESKANRSEIAAMIQEAPMRYVAQEHVNLSMAPIWVDGGFSPRAISVRVHLVATEDGYAVMPGGLTRFSGAGQEAMAPIISMQRGSGSKDTWVVSESEASSHRSLYDARYPIELRRGVTDVPSRVADNLFWLGRNAERSEYVARMLRQVIGRIASDRGLNALPDVAPLWSTLAELGHLSAPAADAQPAGLGSETLEGAMRQAVFDGEQVGSLVQIQKTLQRLAMISRDTLSMDTWRIMREMDDVLHRKDSTERLLEIVLILDRFIAIHAALSGMGAENTTRTPAWRFLDLGRRLERAYYTAYCGASVLKHNELGRSSFALESFLEASDSTITYRRRYFFGPRLLPVLDLLVYDPINPRSIAFQLECIDEHLASLPAEKTRPYGTDARKGVTSLLAKTRTTDLAAKDALEEQRQRQGVAEFLGEVKSSIEAISNDLTRVYFSVVAGEHTPRPSPLVGEGGQVNSVPEKVQAQTQRLSPDTVATGGLQNEA